MAGGRPTDYTPELVQAAWDYVNGGWETVKDAIPSVIGLCKHIGISKTTAYDWAKEEDKQFSDILAACNDYQQHRLLNGGLKGELNAQITKLVLGKHGYHDKVDSDSKSSMTITINQADSNLL